MAELTWGQLKRIVEAAGATDETEIGYIDIDGGPNPVATIVDEQRGYREDGEPAMKPILNVVFG